MRLNSKLLLSDGSITWLLLALIHNVTPQFTNTLESVNTPPSTRTSDTCSTNAAATCIGTFRKLYARHANDASEDEALAQSISCIKSTTNYDCLNPTGNCSALSKDLSSDQTTSGYGLVCTMAGQLITFSVSFSCSNVSSMFDQVLNSTAAFCATKLNTTLTCKKISGIEYIDKIPLLTGAQKAAGCNTTSAAKTSTTTLAMLTNPEAVGRDAMTAIVVFGCLFITCILAAFFFWPKCHISQAPPIPKKVMKTNDAAVGFCPVAAGHEVYDGPVSVNAL